jgi:hypothetical protein
MLKKIYDFQFQFLVEVWPVFVWSEPGLKYLSNVCFVIDDRVSIPDKKMEFIFPTLEFWLARELTQPFSEFGETDILQQV